jgi:hypothetical protein
MASILSAPLAPSCQVDLDAGRSLAVQSETPRQVFHQHGLGTGCWHWPLGAENLAYQTSLRLAVTRRMYIDKNLRDYIGGL